MRDFVEFLLWYENFEKVMILIKNERQLFKEVQFGVLHLFSVCTISTIFLRQQTVSAKFRMNLSRCSALITWVVRAQFGLSALQQLCYASARM